MEVYLTNEAFYLTNEAQEKLRYVGQDESFKFVAWRLGNSFDVSLCDKSVKHEDHWESLAVQGYDKVYGGLVTISFGVVAVTGGSESLRAKDKYEELTKDELNLLKTAIAKFLQS